MDKNNVVSAEIVRQITRLSLIHIYKKAPEGVLFCVVYRKSKQTGFEQVEDFRQKSIYGSQENRGVFPV